MSADELDPEVARQFTICNACRYCDDYCAVFPAIELHRAFEHKDIEYIANLCHDCQACVAACQYAPPHEFAVNIPLTLAAVRQRTYVENAPRTPGTASSVGAALPRLPWLILTVFTLCALGAVAVLEGAGALFSPHRGPGAFYGLVPLWLMELVFLILGVGWALSWIRSGSRFGRRIYAERGAHPGAAYAGALRDALGMSYLAGGGAGCLDHRERLSFRRRIAHQFVLYGFLLDFASTVLAAFDAHVLGIPAPYPFLSPVVLLGTIGGLGIIAGTVVLLWQSGRGLSLGQSTQGERRSDTFALALLLVAVTGILLLCLRDTPVMGSVLIVHLSSVAFLFVTAPYGRFAHGVYRYMALVRNNEDAKQR